MRDMDTCMRGIPTGYRWTGHKQGSVEVKLEAVPTLLSISLELQIKGRGEVEVDTSKA
jgi:hypothetical protein